MEMCPKNVVNICMIRRDNDNRLIGPPIIELEFKKDILEPHIINGGKNIQIQIKKRNQQYVKNASSLGTPKSSAEASGNSAETAQSLCRKEKCTIVGRSFASIAKNPTRQETKNMWRIYNRSHNV